MKRRINCILMFVFIVLMLSSCSTKTKLLFLNWGEYVDEALLEKFEQKYNCSVVMDLCDSNEKFYSKVGSGTTVYDVVCPSDYMVKKMYKNDMLQELDFSKLPNFDKNNYTSSVNVIAKEMENTDDCSGISDYYVPYLSGTWGIMYSTRKAGLESSILNASNEWDALFNRDSLPSGTKVAMYESYQHAYYAACRYLNYDVRATLDSNQFGKIYDLIRKMNFDAWGTDNIKKNIVAGNVDVGFMWTGDFLYYYAENVADKIQSAIDNKDLDVENINQAIIDMTDANKRVYISPSGKKYEVGFDIFIPSNTIAFCDNLVITKNSANSDLAHKFIDFMVSESVTVDDEEVTPAYDNTYYVCYNSPYINIYNQIVELKDYEFSSETSEDDIYDLVYDVATGIAFNKYYPNAEVKGNILATFSRKYVNEITTIFNNAKA